MARGLLIVAIVACAGKYRADESNKVYSNLINSMLTCQHTEVLEGNIISMTYLCVHCLTC